MGRPWIGLAGLLLAAIGTEPVAAEEDDPASFDRPGIAFGTEVLRRGQFAWEQGLPDISFDRPGGDATTTHTADLRWRLGLGRGWELQLALDGYVWQRGRSYREHGGGDLALAAKYGLPSSDQDFSWALLATHTWPTGKSPLSGGEQVNELGVSAAWALPRGQGLTLYLDRAQGQRSQAWTFSPSYTLFSGPAWSGYVEAGWSWGDGVERVAGAGVTWRLARNWQLDLWCLRGLNAGAPDWQGGLGLSWASR